MNKISYQQIIDRCHKTKNKDYTLYYYHRLLSLPFTRLFYRLNVQADTISIAMILLSVLSFIFMIFENTSLFIVGFLLSFVAFLFDKVDGDLARLYGIDNIKGAVYDFVYHRFSIFLFYLGIGIHFSYQNEYLPIIAATAGFIANYIEEMQLLSYRVYAHKYIIKEENINLSESIQYHEPSYFKVLKVFRMQIFLFYYFILAFIINTVYLFMLIALIALVIYTVFQIYITMKYYFDQDIFLLNNSIRGKK